MKTTFRVGEHVAQVEYTTRKAQGKYTVDLAPIAPDALEHSLTGQVNGHFGQVSDTLRALATEANNADVLRLCELWDAVHLNGMRAGTRAQNAALALMPANPKGDHYKSALSFLSERRLNPDIDTGRGIHPSNMPGGKPSYDYGSAWLYNPIESDVVAELTALLERLNDSNVADPTPRAVVARAMAKLKLTVESEFIPFSKSRNKADKHPSLNWRVTVKRDGREVLTTLYSAGSAHCPANKQKDPYYKREGIVWECENGRRANVLPSVGVTGGSIKNRIMPDAADVIVSLVLDSDVMDSGTFEEWARNCGYEPDSRNAESIYRACLEIALKLRNGIGESGLALLRDAAQGC